MLVGIAAAFWAERLGDGFERQVIAKLGLDARRGFVDRRLDRGLSLPVMPRSACTRSTVVSRSTVAGVVTVTIERIISASRQA